MNRYLEIAWLFFRLGLTAFGGPAVHIGMMEEEFVVRRGWISRQHFLDLVGATNLIPGPNSTEMTMHLGYERGRIGGLLLAGACFITPAALITGTMAWVYVTYGDLPEVAPLLWGIKPAVLGVIALAMWRLARKAITSRALALLGVGVLLAIALGVNEVAALILGGVVGMALLRGRNLLPPLIMVAATPDGLWPIGRFFLKVGAILYGSGYVLIAFLQADLVERWGWLTETQLLDAIAVGQFTPGPILTTATFIGYLLGGPAGAIVATVGIFLPSFVFVAILNPILPRLRKSLWAAAFLDSVNVAAVALMVAVVWQIGRSTLTDAPTWFIALAATALSLRYKINTAWLVLGGALVGTVHHLL